MVINGFNIEMLLGIYDNQLDSDISDIDYELIPERFDDFDSVSVRINELKESLDDNQSILLIFLMVDERKFNQPVELMHRPNAETILFDDEAKNHFNQILEEASIAFIHEVYGIKNSTGSYEVFEITKLFDKYRLYVDFSRPVNIFIGANGIGKTTIIRMIDAYFNWNMVDILSVPFEYLGYLYIQDVRDGYSINDRIHSVYEPNDLLPTTEFLIEQYQNGIEGRLAMDLSSHQFLIDVNREVDNFRKLLEELVSQNLYRQFIYNLYSNKPWNARIENLVELYSDEETIRKFCKIQIKNKKNIVDAKRIATSDFDVRIENNEFNEVYPYNWHSVYVDFVNNVYINSKKIRESAWVSKKIEWAVNQEERKENFELYHWWHPEHLSIPNEKAPNKFESTHTLYGRPHLFDMVYENEELYKKYAYMTYTASDFYNEMVPKRVIGNEYSDDVMDLSIIEKLKSEGVMDINKLLYENYYTLDMITEINNIAAKYVDVFFDKRKELESIPGYYGLIEEYVKEKHRFLDNNMYDYDNYFLPALVRDSFFFFNTSFIRKSNISDFWEDTYDELKDMDENQRNNHFVECEWTTENVSLREDIAYYYALNQFIEDNKEDFSSDAMKSTKIVEYEKILRKYFKEKYIEVRPNGLFIRDSLVKKEEHAYIVTYDLDEIDLSVISSGERKIITLFALNMFYQHLLLLMDEPELSLSIVWQETIIPDMMKVGNNKLIVATHSPYIAQDESVKEFINYLPQNDESEGDE